MKQESTTVEDASATSRFLLEHWSAREDCSVDPYDALSANRVPLINHWPRFARVGLVQLNKRLPFDLRPLQGIAPTRNVYTVSHFASAALGQWRLNRREVDADQARSRLAWLCKEQSEAGGWSYPFDVQTKTFYYPRTAPNAICTAFAIRALLDGVEVLEDEGRERWLEAARTGADFVLRDLQAEDDGQPYFCYLQGHDEVIHNANLLLALEVARMGVLMDSGEAWSAAFECAARSRKCVEPDGQILYGEGPHLAWVDGHHTGFVAEALSGLATMAWTAGELQEADELEQAASKVINYYRRKLFEPDGRPLAALGRRFPIDIISGAQGIQTFAKAGGEFLPFAQAIAGQMMATMRSASGTFRYQKGRLHVKAVPYSRWSDAPICLALVMLAERLTLRDERRAGAN